MPPGPMPLPTGEVHVYFADPDALTGAPRVARYLALLSGPERARYQRFHFDDDRHLYLVTRAVARTTLSRYADVAPEAWTFTANAHGRPELEDPAHRWLCFNLSNTRGLVGCVVARSREVGLDVEHLQRRLPLRVANRFFAPAEVAALFALPEPERRQRFFAYWTLKESYIKARGLGLSIPLDQFAFELDRAPGEIGFGCDPRLGDDASTWQFEALRPDEDHAAAVAIRRDAGGPPLPVTVRWSRPLED